MLSKNSCFALVTRRSTRGTNLAFKHAMISPASSKRVLMGKKIRVSPDKGDLGHGRGKKEHFSGRNKDVFSSERATEDFETEKSKAA